MLRDPIDSNVLNMINYPVVEIKYNDINYKVNFCQLICNINKITIATLPEFKKDCESTDFILKIMDECSNHILNKYHDNYKEALDTSEELLRFKKDLNKKVFEHLKIVKLYQEVNVDQNKKVSNKTLTLCNLNINYFNTQVEKEPDEITYLNSMKFPKPRDVQDPHFSSSGRDLVKIIQDVCSLQDQHPNTKRLELQDLSIYKATAKQQKKYKERAIKVSTNKKTFAEATDITLNSIQSEDNFAYMNVEIDNNSFNFLMDSGAMASFIHQSLVTHEVRPSNVRISTAGSAASNENVVGETDITFQIKDMSGQTYTITQTFIVLKKVNGFFGILGADVILDQPYSISLNFENKYWEIKVNKNVVKIPYIHYNEEGKCVTPQNIVLQPNEKRLITVQCTNLDRDMYSHNFVNQGCTNERYTVLPSLNSIQFDENIVSTQLIIINNTKKQLDIPKNSCIDIITPAVNKNMDDVVIENDNFDRSILTKSLQHIVISHCLNKNNNLISEEDILACIGNGKHIAHYLINNITVDPPDKECFNEYAEMLDKSVEGIEKNVTIVNNNDDIVKGHKANIESIDGANPDLVLPDDYLGYVNQNHTTDIGDSDKKPESFSYKDVDLQHIPADIRPKYEELMSKYEHIFALHSWDIGCTNLLTVKLETDKPQKSQKQRQIPQSKMEFVEQAVSELSSAGVIRRAKAWSACSNLILVPKYKNVRYSTKAETLRADPSQIRAYRICVDLRNLNEVLSIKCSSLSKPPEKIIMPLANRMVTNLDVCQAYFSIPLHADSQIMTSFFVDNAVYCFNRLSQGLLPSPRAYEYLNELTYDNDILQEAHDSAVNLNNYQKPVTWNDIIQLFQDDSWLHSPMDFAHHLYYLSLQFYAIARSGLKLSPNKCKIAVTKVKVLGLEVDTANAYLAMDIMKASSILYWPDPSSLYEVHSRLYSLLYYSKFLPKIKELSLPLIELLRDKKFEWKSIHQEAWENIKALIILDLRLHIPGKDDQLYLFTDASKISCSAVLFADIGGSLKIVCTDSTLFNYSDSLKSAFLKESIALIRGLKKFENYLGLSTTRLRVFTDCRSLLYVSRKREYDIASFNISNTLLHYQSIFGFDIFHIKGVNNVYADLASRAFGQSRLIKNNEYNLSKEQSAILPPLPDPFVVDGNLLYKFFSDQPAPERWDTFAKEKKKISIPRPLTNLAKLYSAATPEERTISAIRLLHQWNDNSLTKLDYTKQLNKKLGVDVNNITVIDNKLVTIDKPLVMLHHPYMSDNGHLKLQHTLSIQPKSTLCLDNPLYMQANSHVKLHSLVKDIQIHLHPIDFKIYEVRLKNNTEGVITLPAYTDIARFVSNKTVMVTILNHEDFDNFNLDKIVLPESGISIVGHGAAVDITRDDMCGKTVLLNLHTTTNNDKIEENFDKANIADELILNNEMSTTTMINLQREDIFCSKILDNLESEHQFDIQNGILHKKIEEEGITKLVTVIPECLIKEVLHMIHSSYGHPTLNSFLKIFVHNYFYPGVRKLVNDIMKSCVLCAKAHIRPNFKICRGNKRSYVPTGPRMSISLDIIPKLNSTPEGFENILLIIDNYSRYCSAILMKSKSEISVISALKSYFMQQKVPNHIFSDSEASIISACQKLMKHFDFVLQTSPADSQHRNRSENAFKDLKSIITRILYDPKHKLKSVNWDISLIHALDILNSQPLNNSKLLTREYIHFHNVSNCMPLIYTENFDISPSDVHDILNKQTISKLEKYRSEDKNISKATFLPNTIIYAKCKPDPTVKNTFTLNTKGPFKIITVDEVTKTLQCKLKGSNKLYSIAFENANKIALNDIDLQLYQDFLTKPESRDYNTRPRVNFSSTPLHADKGSEEKVVRRSARLLQKE